MPDNNDEYLKPNQKYILLNGDCLVELKKLPNSSINMVLCDLPYGTTACKWDSVIQLDLLWNELRRVCKKNSAMVFTAQQPFTWALCASNPKEFRYELIWEKPNGTNPFAAKFMPMKKHENILVFYKSQPTYNPQMEKGKPYVWESKRSGGEAGGITGEQNNKIINMGVRYPSSVLKIKQERGLHPTQKPVELMKYLIKTFSNNNDIILDCTMGSGTTGVAALETERRFIGIELDNKYFTLAKYRLEST